MASAPISANSGAFLTQTAVNLYTSPAGTQSVISKFTLTNIGSVSVVCDTYLSSSSTVNTTAPLQTVTVPAGATVTVQAASQHVVPPTGSLLAKASASNVIIAKISVVQFSS